jgi:hypothetical protein
VSSNEQTDMQGFGVEKWGGKETLGNTAVDVTTIPKYIFNMQDGGIYWIAA